MNLWVFDNDGTLYDDTLAEKKFMELLYNYLSGILHLPPDLVKDYLIRIKEKYLTTSSLVAIKKELSISIDEIIENTYLKLDLSSLVVGNTNVGMTLESLNEPRVILSNNPSAYVKKVLECLNLTSYFSGIVGMQELNYILKPHPNAFATLEKLYPGFERYILVDDRLQNVQAAANFGWRAIWFNRTGREKPQEILEILSFSHL